MFEKFLKRSSWTDIVISIIFIIFGVLLIAKPEETKGAITIILSIVTGLLVAYLLQLIPGERLTYLDSFTNVISFIAGILLMLRYNESWILYLVNNVLDLTLWIINFSSGGFDSLMVLLMSVMYLVINIYALFKWRDKNERL